MKRLASFLLAFLVLFAVHEGMHALIAMLYGEYDAFHIRPIGFEVTFRTAPDERSGIQWAFISGASNIVTLLMGYLLLMLAKRLARLRSVFLRASLFYLTVLALLSDPFNLSVGPFIYGGDVNGIAVGLDINRYVIQAIFLVVLLVNRELISQKLFPIYAVQVEHILFRPLLRRSNRTQGVGR